MSLVCLFVFMPTSAKLLCDTGKTRNHCSDAFRFCVERLRRLDTEPPLLYLYSLGIVSDETPQERQRSLMPRTRFACVNFAIAMSLSMAVRTSNDARTLLHSRRTIRTRFCCPQSRSNGTRNGNQDAHVVRSSSRRVKLSHGSVLTPRCGLIPVYLLITPEPCNYSTYTYRSPGLRVVIVHFFLVFILNFPDECVHARAIAACSAMYRAQPWKTAAACVSEAPCNASHERTRGVRNVREGWGSHVSGRVMTARCAFVALNDGSSPHLPTRAYLCGHRARSLVEPRQRICSIARLKWLS